MKNNKLTAKAIFFLVLGAIFIIGSVIGINYVTQKRQEEQARKIRIAKEKKRKASLIKFKKYVVPSFKKSTVSLNTARYDTIHGLTLATDLISQKEIGRSEQIKPSDIKESDADLINKYFKTSDPINSLATIVINSAATMCGDSFNNKYKFIFDSQDLATKHLVANNGDYVFLATLTYHDTKIQKARDKLNISIYVDSLSGRISSIQPSIDNK